ncbi:MAG: hypothetical protein ACE5H4_16085 [Candidatus Thorarchaeota archaeon]
MKGKKHQELISETRVLGTLFVLPIVLIAYNSMWIHGWESPRPLSILSSIALATLFSIMPSSVVVLLLLYRLFKKNTSSESFKRRVLLLFLLALPPSLSSSFVSLFSLSLVELGKTVGLACSLFAYGFTMIFSGRLLDKKPDSTGV